MKMTCEDLMHCIGGRVVQRGTAVAVETVSIDTRSLTAGDWFFAIPGGHYDGHAFVADAIARGAIGVVVANDISGIPEHVSVLRVDDSIAALGRLAAAWRAQCTNTRCVAITGSNGKSTTKEMVASVAQARGAVLKTEGNFNNLIGMPLTMFRLQPTHETAVIEMGMSEFGEIAAMTRIAQPDVGIITNVSAAHLVKLQTIDNVAAAKGELFANMPAHGTIVVNHEDRFVVQQASGFAGRTMTFGMQNHCDVQFGRMSSDGLGHTDLSIYMHGTEYRTSIPLPGTHNVMNALAAAAAGLALDITPEAIVERLPQFTPMRMRMERVQLENGVQVINDCYNANPLSMQMALRTVSVAKRAGRFIAVLGDMLELGNEAHVRHKDLGSQIVAAGVDLLVVCGEHAHDVASGAYGAGMPSQKVTIAKDVPAAAEAVCHSVQPGDVVLVKGSRGMRMERVVESLKNHCGVC